MSSELKSSNKISISGSKSGEERRLNHRSFSIHSQEIFDSLSKYGVVPNKTWLTYLPILDDKSLMRHLIRGIIDGDGWVQQKRGNIGLCGNRQLLLDITQYLEDELGIQKPTVHIKNKNSEFSSLEYCKKEYKEILFDYLYKDSEYYLIRKKENLENYLVK